MQRLLRASLSQLSVAPVAVIVPKVRIVSPLPGSSTLTTSAPNSPSTVAQNGPASTLERSRTRTPSSALFFFGSTSALMERPPEAGRYPSVEVKWGKGVGYGLLSSRAQRGTFEAPAKALAALGMTAPSEISALLRR